MSNFPLIAGFEVQPEIKKAILPGINFAIDPSAPAVAGIGFIVDSTNFILTIKNKDGSPIVSADAVITEGEFSRQLVTDSDGVVRTSLPSNKTYTLKLSYQGKQFYKDTFTMNYEEKGVYEWEISLSQITSSLIDTQGNLYVPANPADPENQIII